MHRAPVEARRLLPLTANQANRLAWADWLRAQEIGLPPHHLAYPSRLLGRLDRACLWMALREVVSRHEALRARFPVVDGARVQAIVEPGARDVEIVEAGDTGLDAGEWAAATIFRPFDLAGGPLVRAGLLPTGPDEHVLVLAAEHLVADALSFTVVLEELSAVYAALAGAAPAPRWPDPPSWTRHVLDERDWLDGPRFSRELDYWRRRLAGRSPVAAAGLPTLGPTAPARQYLARIEAGALDAELSDRLDSLATSSRVTLSSALLAVLATVLLRRSGAPDVVVLCPNGNRWRRDLARSVGWIANMMAIRVERDDGATFRQLARGVQRDVLDGIAHGRTPFDELVRCLSPEHYGILPPAGCTFFSLAPARRHRLDLPGIVATPFPVAADLWTMGISVDCAVTDSGVAVLASLDRGLYDGAQTVELVSDLVTVARAVVDEPDAPLARLT